MMRTVVELSRTNVRLLKKMVEDVSEGRMCGQREHLPNHPAWQVGHLTFVRAAVARVVGRPVEISEEWLARFAPRSVPVGDAGAYPTKEELVATFVRAQEHLERVLPEVGEEVLDAVNPVERVRDRMPTVRHMVVYLMTAHDGFHMGQIADWRRAEGLPGVM